ncbi:MAG: FAD-dependent oxidoreductase [Bacillota bacterium]
MKKFYDVVIVGGGPAGLAAGISATKEGASVLIIERNNKLGGILNQCIHNGFGLHYFKEELTGPEYAGRFVQIVREMGIDYMLETMVVSLSANKEITAISPEHGIFTISAKSVVLAMGCRERTAGAIKMLGSRPAGIYTAGSAQRILNIDGYNVGKKVVILGSGDIGLIMARRMTYEGAEVKEVLELMPYSSGLKRNIVQCLDDYNIPLSFSTTITKVVGKTRLEGVYVAPVDSKMQPILTEERFIECDTLLLSVGLLPETDLVSDIGLDFDRITTGGRVNEYRESNLEGFFMCGNVLHVHDLVDNVSEEGAIAGSSAAKYALGTLVRSGKEIAVKATCGVRYALPQIICGGGKVKVYFRVDKVYKNATITVKCGDTLIVKKKKAILAPGEMESIAIDTTVLTGDVTLALEV